MKRPPGHGLRRRGGEPRGRRSPDRPVPRRRWSGRWL